MIKIEDKTRCCGCSACANICPKNCISMKKDDEGFLYPVVDLKLCINCGLCENVCQYKKDSSARKKKPESYAAKIKDERIINNSSSGGMFPLLAEEYLNNNGVVYGVAFNKDYKSVKFIRVDNKNDLNEIMRSKYLQSSMGDIYKQIRDDLIGGKKVLFSGVPCQVVGLKLFLKKEYDNLFAVEVICHGTPSQSLWEKYFNHLEKKYNAKVEEVNFRKKLNSNNAFGLIREEDKIEQYLNQHEDPYMIMFLKDICLRPSCYSCKAKELESMADLTLADLWGVQDIVPDLNDDKGTSLVLIHSKKGLDILNRVKDKCLLKQIQFDDAIKFNPSYYKSAQKPVERNTFYTDINMMDFEQIQKKYCKPKKGKWITRLKRFIKRIIKKLFFRKKTKKAKFMYGLSIKMKGNK